MAKHRKIQITKATKIRGEYVKLDQKGSWPAQECQLLVNIGKAKFIDEPELDNKAVKGSQLKKK